MMHQKRMLGVLRMSSNDTLNVLLRLSKPWIVATKHSRYQKWVWMHNGSVSSEASEGNNGVTSDGFAGYVYTARTGDLTSRNVGWLLRMGGMLKYNDLYKQTRKDQLEDNSAYDRECIAHCVEKTKNKRKGWRDNGGRLRSLTVSDVIGRDLLGALDTGGAGAGGGYVAAVSQHCGKDR
jgi:hypothetical protein